MRVVITYNLRATNDVQETVFASPATVEFLTASVGRAGHTAIPLEVSGPVADVVAELLRYDPDLVFNVAEGWADSGRQTFYTCLLARLGMPFTGSGPLVQALARDKHLTKLVLREYGVRTPRWRFATEDNVPDLTGLRFPVIVKPNAGGTSQGITQDSVVETPTAALSRAEELLTEYPEGVLIEEYIAGRELTVGYLAAVDNDFGGVLQPTEILLRPPVGVRDYRNILDHSFKNYQNRPLGTLAPEVRFQTPADLPEETARQIRTIVRTVVRAMRCEDIARVDFRLSDDGVPYLLEVNTLPGLEPGLSMHRSGEIEGLDAVDGVVHAVLASASRRYGLVDSSRRSG